VKLRWVISSASASALPPLQHPAGAGGHHLGEPLDPLAVEGGLGQAPLALPEVAAGGDQPVAQQRLEPVVDEVLLVLEVMVVEHVAHAVRVGHHEGGLH